MRVTVQLLETDTKSRMFQPPPLPQRREETYFPVQLDLLSPGEGGKVADLEAVIVSALVADIVGIPLAVYVDRIFKRGLKADVFDPLPEIDVLDPSGAVADVPVEQLPAGAGIIEDDLQPYPIIGWLEVYWLDATGRVGATTV